MNKKRKGYYKVLFLIAAIYDLVLGIIFTFFYKFTFSLLGIPIPTYPGYISLIGVFLIVLGVAYYFIYRGDLVRNLDLIRVGTFYKFAYIAVVLYYWIFATIPHIIFVALFVVADLIFLILFIECILHIKKVRIKKK